MERNLIAKIARENSMFINGKNPGKIDVMIVGYYGNNMKSDSSRKNLKI